MGECGISRRVPVEGVAKGSFADNLALAQFLMNEVERNCPGAHTVYDAYQRRQDAILSSPSSRRPAAKAAARGNGARAPHDAAQRADRDASFDAGMWREMGREERGASPQRTLNPKHVAVTLAWPASPEPAGWCGVSD